jgi:exosortase A-associated hydrolase 2
VSESTLEPAFIDGSRGQLFVLLRRPGHRDAAPCALIVPPFAEEMNKTRPMFTMVARGLAARGVATILPDLFGTGDSEGEFREGDWQTWQDDLLRAATWAETQGCRVDRLLCVRLGCILGATVAARLPTPVTRTVFWQPVLDGERFMTQFLRLRVAASMMEDRQETVGGLRERLRGGETLEVAGYELSPMLVTQIADARLGLGLEDQLGQVHWMEIVRGEAGDLPVASRQAIEAARPKLCAIESFAIPGEPYWSATEIVRIPTLVEHTVSALAEAA